MKKQTIFFTLALLFLAQGLWADTYTFTGSGDWDLVANWDSYPGATINPGDDVIINGSGACSVNINVFINGGLTVNAGKTLSVDVSGQFQVDGSLTNNGNFTNNGTFTGNSGNAFINNGTYIENGVFGAVYGAFINDGTIIVSAGKTLEMAEVTNNGTMTVNGTLNFSDLLTINTARTITVASGGTLNNNGILTDVFGNLTVNGTLNLVNDLTVYAGGTFTNIGTTTVSYLGASEYAVTISGAINLQSGSTFDLTEGAFLYNGTSGNIAGMLRTINIGDVAIAAGKTLALSSGGELESANNVQIQGTLTGNGALNSTNDVTIASGGTYNPTGGTSSISGQLIDNGTLSIGSGATVNVYNTFTHNSAIAASISGTLTTKGTATINLGKVLTINSGGTYRHEGAAGNLNGTITNNGTFQTVANSAMSVNASAVLTHSGTAAEIDGTLTINGTLSVNAGAVFTVQSNGSLSINANTNLNGTLLNQGETIINSGKTLTVAVGGLLSQNGTGIYVNGNLQNNGSVTIASSKTMSVSSGATLTQNGTNFSVDGALSVSGALTVNASQTLTIQNSGALTIDGTSANINGTLSLISSGTFTVSSGKTLSISNTGALQHSSGVEAEVSGTLSNSGVINVGSGSAIRVLGTLTNNGLIKGNGAFIENLTNPAAGSIAPGSSPGCLTFNGNFTNSGSLLIELADGSACSDYDYITVNGNATINGTIIISFPSGAPSGSMFTILSASGTLNAAPSLTFPSGYTGSASISSGNLIVTFNLILPVELSAFNARAAQNAVELNWNTESEAGNKGFEIQRSANSTTWETIGFVQGNGDTQAKHDYGFFDRQPYGGANYYRLKQIDFDGKYTLSNIVAVNMPESDASIRFFPNPAVDHVSCSIQTDYEGAVNIRLYNAMGRLVLEKQILTEGPAQEDLELSDLPAGLYVTEVIAGATRYVGRLAVR